MRPPGNDPHPSIPADAVAIRRAWVSRDMAALSRLVLTTPTGWTICALAVVLTVLAFLLVGASRIEEKPAPVRDCRSCAATPLQSPATWVTTDDYPASAMREEREGVTAFTVTVDPAGQVAQCRVTQGSGHAALDAATCRAIESRARFQPATDGEGRAVTGEWSSRVRWQLP